MKVTLYLYSDLDDDWSYVISSQIKDGRVSLSMLQELQNCNDNDIVTKLVYEEVE